MLHITLKGGDVREVAENTTAEELCRDISMGLFRAACAVRIDGAVCDLRVPLTKDCAVEFLTFEDEDGRKAFRHTASHILAQAVLHLFPGVKFAIGPAKMCIRDRSYAGGVLRLQRRPRLLLDSLFQPPE